MRFYLDEDLSDRIAVLARERGLDVTSSHEQELRRDSSPDESQLALAAGEGRCIVTKNGQDFHALTTIFREREFPHAGVLVVPSSLDGSEFDVIVERLAHWHELYPDGAAPYFLSYL
jgi:predicted nuclease of predicted toxin-antitoxin system